MVDDTPSFYTVSAAARRLQVHEATFRRWMDKGLIPYVCLINRSKKHKYLIKDETINEIIVQGIVQAALERAYEQEAEKEYESYVHWRDHEQDVYGH